MGSGVWTPEKLAGVEAMAVVREYDDVGTSEKFRSTKKEADWNPGPTRVVTGGDGDQ